MVFVRSRTVNGKKRYYLERSIRLPDGKTKKYSIYLKDYKQNSDMKTNKDLLKDKIAKDIANSKYYKKDLIFTIREIKKLERIKLDYKDIIKALTKNQLQDVIDRFTVNFTYESNAIEGNSLTLKDVTMVLQEKKVIKGKDLREIYETVNTREAMGLIFNRELKINKKDIIKLHQVLVKDTGVNLGYKKVPNFIIARNMKTTLPENVEKEMDKLIKWYNENENLYTLKKISIFHGEFERIHPFEDGNGRVGRLLINIMLMKSGYPPLIIRKTHQISYFAALEASDKGYEGKLDRFLIEKYKNTFRKFFEIYMKYLK